MVVKTLKTLVPMLLLWLAVAAPVRAYDDEVQAKTVSVMLKGLTLKLPTTWASSDTVSSMRLATYEIPASMGDKDKGELSVFSFPGGGGGVAANLERWVGQFSTKGRTMKVTQGTTDGKATYYLADIAGTFNKPVGPPVLRQTEAAEGYRMLAAIIVLENEDVYYLKLTGQDATIKAQTDAFRASFGGDAKQEKPYEL